MLDALHTAADQTEALLGAWLDRMRDGGRFAIDELWMASAVLTRLTAVRKTLLLLRRPEPPSPQTLADLHDDLAAALRDLPAAPDACIAAPAQPAPAPHADTDARPRGNVPGVPGAIDNLSGPAALNDPDHDAADPGNTHDTQGLRDHNGADAAADDTITAADTGLLIAPPPSSRPAIRWPSLPALAWRPLRLTPEPVACAAPLLQPAASDGRPARPLRPAAPPWPGDPDHAAIPDLPALLAWLQAHHPAFADGRTPRAIRALAPLPGWRTLSPRLLERLRAELTTIRADLRTLLEHRPAPFRPLDPARPGCLLPDPRFFDRYAFFVQSVFGRTLPTPPRPAHAIASGFIVLPRGELPDWYLRHRRAP